MKHYLLDTHALLWACSEPTRLSERVRELITDSQTGVFVSMATVWELTIKQSIGKITLPESFFEEIWNNGYTRLPIENEHCHTYRKLPLMHRDPFDRILIAQAQHESLTLISCDSAIQEYDVRTLW